jgi:hypothetical protein
MWATNWLGFGPDVSGAKVNWSNKRVTNIEFYINAFNLQADTTYCHINFADWDNPAATAWGVHHGGIHFEGGAGWQYIARGAPNEAGWEAVLRWLQADKLVCGVLHWNHGENASSFLIWSSALIAVDYEDTTPPAALQKQHILWEF